jgi:mutator protein MutT
MNIIIHHQKKQYHLINDLDKVVIKGNSSVYQVDNLDDFDFFFINDNEENEEIYLLFNEPTVLLNHIKTAFTVIQAAGGVVKNQNNDILMINRRGCWDLPKGKLDDGETLAQCAIREVTEETGVTPIENEQFLGITYHTYIHNHNWVLKESHWYIQKTTFTGTLIPQTEEDIVEVKWIKNDVLNAYFSNTYGNIVYVLQAYLNSFI